MFSKNAHAEFDLIALGRACIDLNAIEFNRPMEETSSFSKYVGGSPANIAIGCSRLGLRTGFIGKIPDDQHGRFIRRFMQAAGVDTAGMVEDRNGRKAGLAFTEIKSPTECSILMYRENVADLYLDPQEISEDYIRRSASLLISGTALAQSPSREAAFQAIRYARKNGVSVLFELDYRPYTWKSAQETAAYYMLAAQFSDVVIGTRDEFDIMEGATGGSNEATVAELFANKAELVVIKHGVEGSYAFTRDGKVAHGGVYKSKVLKTFGAGDSYAAALIYALHSGKDMATALRYGSAAAAIVISKHSCSEAMPTVAEIETVIREQGGV